MNVVSSKKMLVKTKGCALMGVDAIQITIEVNVSMGQGYCIVGLPDSSVKESLDRTESAIKANGFRMPRTKLVINLSPAEIKKTGAAFDLPIAIGILAASEQIDPIHFLDQYIIMGELGLDGKLSPIKGVLAMALHAKAAGYLGIILPNGNAEEASLVDELAIYCFEHLNQVVDFIKNPSTKTPLPKNKNLKQRVINPIHDFSNIKGQIFAKRALEIASAGGHNMIMIGPPGAGKTMLAKSVVSIIPPLTAMEALETSIIYSISGQLDSFNQLLTHRPFRQPHHSLSSVALIGGGTHPHPGEISLAHNGVLFLDELPEFNRSVIEVLRQPMEEGKVCISRAKASLSFPARFMLIAAMNPCPCGYYNHPQKECHCSQTLIQKYKHKISGPVLDRIDLHIEVIPVPYQELRTTHETENSETIANRVYKARCIQSYRFKDDQGIYTNAQMSQIQLKKYCTLTWEGENLLKTAMEKFQLSARAIDRIIKVSRSIADLENIKNIQPSHISEALQFRTLDKSNWGKFKN